MLELAAKLDHAAATAQASWVEFTRNVDALFDKIERDVDDAVR